MKTFVMEQMDIQMLFHIEQIRQTVWTIGWYWQNVEVNSDGQDINGLICKYLGKTGSFFFEVEVLLSSNSGI